MAALHAHVSEKRKGIKNALKSWWRKPKEAAHSPAPTGSSSVEMVPYPLTTIEAQIRLLGDFCFLVRDWEMASSMMRLVKEDFKVRARAPPCRLAVAQRELTPWPALPSADRPRVALLRGDGGDGGPDGVHAGGAVARGGHAA